MTAQIVLNATKREVIGRRVKKGRKEGMIPCVTYGHDIDAVSLWINALDFEKIYRTAGESTIFELLIDGKNKVSVLIQDTQVDPIINNFSHIDFFQVRMDEEIETEVPLEFIGESAAVKEGGGMLLKNVEEISVRCLPAKLPAKFEVDLSMLKTFDDHFTIENLKIPAGVEVLAEMSTIIVMATPPRSDEELAGLDEKIAADVSAVESVTKPVEEEGKKEEAKE